MKRSIYNYPQKEACFFSNFLSDRAPALHAKGPRFSSQHVNVGKMKRWRAAACHSRQYWVSWTNVLSQYKAASSVQSGRGETTAVGPSPSFSWICRFPHGGRRSQRYDFPHLHSKVLHNPERTLVSSSTWVWKDHSSVAERMVCMSRVPCSLLCIARWVRKRPMSGNLESCTQAV